MEDIAFPRGGRPAKLSKEQDDGGDVPSKKLRPSEIKKKRKAEATQSPEFLFGGGTTANEKSPSSSNKKSKSTSAPAATTTSKHSLLPLGGGGVIVQSNKHNNNNKTSKSTSNSILIEALSFGKLVKGTKLLGVVREVQDEFAVLALPNLLTGYMLPSTLPATKKPQSLKQCLSVHQVLAVVVQKVATEQLPGGKTKKRIQVSALPTLVNPREVSPSTLLRGQVVSIEDHGCLVDLGLGQQGFLKFDKIEGDYVILEDGDVTSSLLDPEDQDQDGKTKGKKNKRILQPGRLYDFVVADANNNNSKDSSVRSLALPLPSKLAQQIILPPTSHGSTSSSYTLGSLQPGMLVSAKVEALAKNGVCVTFLGNVFRGALELGPHLGIVGLEEESNSWRDLFLRHQHFAARIVAIDVPSKLIRLSVAPHVLSYTAAPTPSTITTGAKVDDCTVVRVDQGIGALLALPEQYHGKAMVKIPKKLLQHSDLFAQDSFQKAMTVPTVYVHISKAYDDDEANKKSSKDHKARRDLDTGRFHKEFALGSHHAVRILNTSHCMDGVASGACAPSLLEAHVLTHADLKPGQVFHQVPIIAKLEGGSLLVQLGGPLGNPVRGLIPSPLHLVDKPSSLASSDFRRRVLETKFAVDQKIDVRVLTVDHAKKKCILTAKKGMVKVEKENTMIVTSYEDLKVGQTVVGFISKMDDRALWVTFCNKVYGKVTAKSLALELGVENHQENYHVGDVVTCRVVQVRKTHKGRRRGSLEDDAEDEDPMDVDDQEQDDSSRAFCQVLLSLKLQGNKEDGKEDEDTAMDEVSTPDMERAKAKMVHIKAGTILPEKSMKIVELHKCKRRGNKHFVPGYAVVSIKSKYLLDESERSSTLPQMDCKLPFDQLVDDYDAQEIETPEALDALAAQVLKVGKKINQKAIVLTDPHKSNVDHSSGIGRLAVVSLRKKLIATMERQNESGDDIDSKLILLPSPKTHLFVGAVVQGYIAHIDSRHGAFMRFLDGMTGLIPRMNGGLDLETYNTILAKVQVIDDTVKPFRILLEPVGGTTKKTVDHGEAPFKIGDIIATAKVKAVGFLEAKLQVLDDDDDTKAVHAVMHATMKDAPSAKIRLRKTPGQKDHLVKGHPFFGLKKGDILSNVTVAHVEHRKGRAIVHVTDRAFVADGDEEAKAPTFVSKQSQLKAGMTIEAVVTEFGPKNKGLHVMVSPLVKGYIPGLELSPHLNVLNGISSHVPLGARLTCVVMDDSQWHENRAKSPFATRAQKSWMDRKSAADEKRDLYLSVLAVGEPTLGMEKPSRNDLIIGRINKSLPQHQGPSLMLTLRAGFLARCCVTELTEVDEWENLPLGLPTARSDAKDKKKTDKIDLDPDDDEDEDDSSPKSGHERDEEQVPTDDGPFADGKYVKCRVLKAMPKQSLVEVSLRGTRLEGDLDDDVTPPEGETVQGYVVETNKKGCFVRLARHIEGRATLTELCDGFLPDPKASFPPGRLVVGKIKSIAPVENKPNNSKSIIRFRADLDMRESTLLDSKKALKFEDIEIQSKHRGTVTRVESYGVFVQIENSKVSGLVHLSECSDNFVKNLAALYSPGDPVKVLVIKKDDEEKKIGFSMKASHFQHDEDSDASSSDGSDHDDDDDDVVDAEHVKSDSDEAGDDLESDDENFASKLAAKMKRDAVSKDKSKIDSGDSESDEEASSDSESASESDSEGSNGDKIPAIDTTIGFDWSFGEAGASAKKDEDSSDDSDSSDSDSDKELEGMGKRLSHKSKKKQAQRRREESEISKRETALADGTADENPETAGDFERLLAVNPNSSELWIRYMAFYLSLADVPAARLVADKALERIEFREEREKLNVWTALLTLEHKYGNEESLRKTIDRACGQNNPKQVYLRVCEILDKDLSSPEGVARADAMYAKLCSKFKSKKKAWLAYLSYLVRQSRHEEANSLLKRALLSLAPYKHAETMSKFAQLEFEFGSSERARTIFDGIVAKYPKRLDLFFVYVDKEVKFGSFKTARSLLESKVEKGNLSDKQVKSLFKKWYRLEELHGNEESMEHVKESARQYVQKTGQ